MTPKRKILAPRRRKKKDPPKPVRSKTRPGLGRKKDAPPKPAAGETLGEAILRCVYGRFYNDDLLQWISAASLMTPGEEERYRQAAASEMDPDRKRSILGSADLVRDLRSDLDQNVSRVLVPALMRGDADVFEDVAAIIKKCYKGAGAPVFDPSRHKLLLKYERLCISLRRPPTIEELRRPEGAPFPPDNFGTMPQSQLKRMCGRRDLNLTLTPKPLVSALKKIPRSDSGLTDLKLVKNALRRSVFADRKFEDTDHEFLCFAESVDLEFDPHDAIRANHHCLQVRTGRPPSAQELGLHLKGYVIRRLNLKGHADVARVCRRLSLGLTHN